MFVFSQNDFTVPVRFPSRVSPAHRFKPPNGWLNICAKFFGEECWDSKTRQDASNKIDDRLCRQSQLNWMNSKKSSSFQQPSMQRSLTFLGANQPFMFPSILVTFAIFYYYLVTLLHTESTSFHSAELLFDGLWLILSKGGRRPQIILPFY